MMACGTSWHAAIVGEYLFEDLARIPVEVEYASEFRYRNPVVKENDILFAISQSGETADTLAAIELAKVERRICFWYLQCGGFFHCACNACRLLTRMLVRKSVWLRQKHSLRRLLC